MPSISLLKTYQTGGAYGLYRRLHDGLIYRYHKQYNLRFDRHYAIDTEDSVRLQDLAFEHVNKIQAVDYEATPIRIVSALIQAVPVCRQTTAFIDIGCGKGRVLIEAMRLGYKRVIGVEFARDIASIANHNLSKLSHTWRSSEWSVDNIDAAEFKPPRQDLLIFMYNPFDDVVLSQVAAWITRHCEYGHTVHIIYYNPQHASVLDAQSCLKPFALPIGLKLKLGLLSWHKVAVYSSV